MRFLKKATAPDAKSLFTSLYWAAPGNAINCTIQSLLSAVATTSWANHLRSKQSILSTPSYTSRRSSIKWAPILTKDILSKIAWSGASETAMMTEYIENDITKWKSIFSWSIENNLNTQTRVNKSTYLKTALRNQVFSYDQDELLTDDGRLNKIRELWRRITSFLLIFRPKFLYDS